MKDDLSSSVGFVMELLGSDIYWISVGVMLAEADVSRYVC
jgi:hypothetical protein